ncbi:ABC transporter ATP-binding protein [Microbacterium thalassium]|uniref:ABC-2 type transport system ATP-binding protein n=1 Tax=Microbacterium thalassium TaxID=362649 RepID=A0A7X0FNJ5_9MICO|nr:ABC transporter ATP-binding protein [Microbacterium thalassium]MBB6390788.1 ABC-2 type transport system ATP-binding protein [Microbacterium thalassium]GLK25896.1 tetronasin ABC transporter ATP-binding protein [Microbacterium thalassium]
MSDVILTRGLDKHYGSVRALDGLDLTVAAGQIHGFLGPNGAGKTTTIRILLGLARATSGEATVFGSDPWTDAVAIHRRVASVPGDVSIWPNLSGGEAIDFLARLRGARTGDRGYKAQRDRLMEAFQFDPRKKGRAYSKGNRQKVALIAAFAVPADLYVLDEPTSGLDPLMAVTFQRELARVRDAGATVLLSSHILSEVEQVCDRVSIIRAGRIVESGTLAELRHLTRTQVSFALDGDQSVADIAGAHDLAVVDGRAQFTVDSDAIADVLPELARRRVEGLRVAPPSLEELFLRHYGDDLTTDSVGRATRRGTQPTGSRS